MIKPDLWFAFDHALQAATSLMISHGLAVALVMYMDLSGKWTPYAICKSRPKKHAFDYWKGCKSFCVDLIALFIPCMTWSIWYKADAIFQAQDNLYQSAIKFMSGYVLGKIWACAIHYILHHPKLYQFHRRHHQKPANMVASSAWDDSFVEYAIMEIPSFGLTLFCFPTHWWVHLAHFALHGMDGAAGHSGFKAPGILGKGKSSRGRAMCRARGF